VESLGAKIIGCGAIVRFDAAPKEIEGVEIKSLVDYDVKMYKEAEDCVECKDAISAETVRF